MKASNLAKKSNTISDKKRDVLMLIGVGKRMMSGTNANANASAIVPSFNVKPQLRLYTRETITDRLYRMFPGLFPSFSVKSDLIRVGYIDNPQQAKPRVLPQAKGSAEPTSIFVFTMDSDYILRLLSFYDVHKQNTREELLDAKGAIELAVYREVVKLFGHHALYTNVLRSTDGFDLAVGTSETFDVEAHATEYGYDVDE